VRFRVNGWSRGEREACSAKLRTPPCDPSADTGHVNVPGHY